MENQISKGTDGFKESFLRSLYRSQRDKRGLICSDYPKILEECGDEVEKSEKKKVVVSGVTKRQMENYTTVIKKENKWTRWDKSKNSKENSVYSKSKEKCGKCIVGNCDWMPDHCKSNQTNSKKSSEVCTVLVAGKPRPCDWMKSSSKRAVVIERANKECGGFYKWKWTQYEKQLYVCNNPKKSSTKLSWSTYRRDFLIKQATKKCGGFSKWKWTNIEKTEYICSQNKEIEYLDN